MIDDDVVFLIIARTRSSRLPGKVFLTLRPNITILEQTIIQTKFNNNNKITLLFDETSPLNIPKNISERFKINFFKGNKNPTKRIIEYLRTLKKIPKYFVRITSDNPLISIEAIIKLKHFIKNNNQNSKFDYLFFENLIPGTKPELFSTKSLLTIEDYCIKKNLNIGEHLTLYYILNKNKFVNKGLNVDEEIINKKNISLTVDDINQYESLVNFLEKLNLKRNQIFLKDLQLKHLHDYPHKNSPIESRYKDYQDYIL